MDKETIEKAKKEWELIQKLGLQDILYKPYCLDGDYNPYDFNYIFFLNILQVF